MPDMRQSFGGPHNITCLFVSLTHGPSALNILKYERTQLLEWYCRLLCFKFFFCKSVSAFLWPINILTGLTFWMNSIDKFVVIFKQTNIYISWVQFFTYIKNNPAKMSVQYLGIFRPLVYLTGSSAIVVIHGPFVCWSVFKYLRDCPLVFSETYEGWMKSNSI